METLPIKFRIGGEPTVSEILLAKSQIGLKPSVLLRCEGRVRTSANETRQVTNHFFVRVVLRCFGLGGKPDVSPFGEGLNAFPVACLLRRKDSCQFNPEFIESH
jgi:hypothetical protein